jgi:hypothetical protein
MSLLQVQDVNTLAGTAKSIIKTIQRRAVTNKLILGFIIFLLLAINIALLYLVVRKMK